MPRVCLSSKVKAIPLNRFGSLDFSSPLTFDQLLPEVVDPGDLVRRHISAACPGDSCDGRHAI